MGQDLWNTQPPAREVFDRVSQAVGRDVADLCFHSDAETLKQTQNAQIALYTCGLAATLSLPELPVAAYAGHSVGEYAALAAAGVISLEDGAKLVQRRGDIMAEAGIKRPGTMAAVLGMAIPDLEEALKDLEPQGVAVVANDNCPGQVVISGDVNAIAAAGALLPERGAKRVLGLNVSGAFHSPLMEDSARQMAEALGAASFGAGRAPVFSNVTAAPGSDWASLLEQQLKSRVRWTESVLAMKEAGVSAIIECGAGEVLCGMIRRIDRDLRTLKVVDAATLGEVRSSDITAS